MSKNSNYETWLERQNELVVQGFELIQKYKFKVSIIERERKPNFIRIFFGENKVDFFIKEVKTKFVRSIWLCKREDFNPKYNYLLFTAKEDKWYITTGVEVDRSGEDRESDWKKGTMFIVVPTEIFRLAPSFLKSMRKRYDAQLQRRMTEWI